MSIAYILGDAIEKWISEKDSRSVTMLARLSRVSYSTIRRIMQNETDPLTENALKIAAIVMTRAELQKFTGEHFPALVEARTDIAFTSGDDLLEYLENKNYIPILLLASHAAGTNEEEVRNFFGNEMSLRFTELVNSGHLERSKGSNWHLEKDVGSVSLETAREWLGVMAGICPSLNDNIPKASLAHTGWESVNFQTALAVYHAAMDFVRTATKLTADKNNKGDILIMYGSLFNVLKGVEAFK